VDRCHRFDFHRPSIEQIATVVRRTAQAESIEIPPQAVAAVARAAAGSFRDALGTLEQLVTFSGREIQRDDVLAVLGVADSELLARTVDAVAREDAREALVALGEFLEAGRDAGSFARDLEGRARELLVVQTLGEVPAELSLTADADAAPAQQGQCAPAAGIARLREEIGSALEAMRAGGEQRTRLEIALVKAAKPSVDQSTRALLERIERLEEERPPLSAVASERPIEVPSKRRRASAPAPERQGAGQSLPQGAGQPLPQGAGQSMPQGAGQPLPQGAGQSMPHAPECSEPQRTSVRVEGESTPAAA